MRCRASAASVAGALLLALATTAGAADAPHAEGAHFVSLRAEGAYGRSGPGNEHRIDWIYERAGLPLLVIAENGPWRRVRDPDGGEVWMHTNSLAPRRTAYVQGRHDIEMRAQPRANAEVAAYLAPGVVGAMTGCEGSWRRIAVGARVGWVPAEAIWGAGETCGQT